MADRPSRRGVTGHDVAIVGGGPVGLVAGILAARSGLRTLLIEQREQPVDKACGEGILPAGMAFLAGLGIDPPGMPLTGITYADDAGRRASAAFRRGPGRGVRRTVLQETLLAHAASDGVELRTERVRDLGQVAALGARYVIAADGLHSPIRRELGLDRPAATARHGLVRHWPVAPWSDRVEVHWSSRAEAYVTPVSPDSVGIALLTAERESYVDLLADFGELSRRLAGATPGPVLGAGPFGRAASGVRRDNVLLVGDAAAYVDALTGEGLTSGWLQAAAAIRAIAADRPEDYAAAWPRVTARARWVTRGVVALAESRATRPHLVRAARAVPPAFSLAVNTIGRG